MRRHRNSYIETSYTGVGAFSSAPAPNSNALAAASVIGNALKNNNHNPNGLEYPKIQPPRATLAQRAGSITSNSPPARNSPNRQNSIRTSGHSSSTRNNSVDTATARRLSLSSIPKQRLSYQKSAPSLNGRRSVSDFSNTNTSTNGKPIVHLPARTIPKTIKRYVPSANGLVAIEVPNPEHPDNMSVAQKKSIQRSNSYRRSVSLAHLPTTKNSNRGSSLTQPNNFHFTKKSETKEPSRSLTKNIKRETRILPNGTKVVSTTVEEYYNTGSDGEFEDSYENFDGEIDNKQVDMSVTLDENDFQDEAEVVVAHDYSTHEILDEIHEEEEIDENESAILKSANTLQIENDTKFEDEVKKAISKNEELESHDRETAFKSTTEPIKDSVIYEDLLTRKFTHVADAHPNKIGLSGIVSHGLSNSNTPNDNTPTTETPPANKVDFNKNIENSYDDFYESEVVNKEPTTASYDDELQDGDYTNDIDEIEDDIEETFKTQKSAEQVYTEEEYLAAQKKLDEAVKAAEKKILDSVAAETLLQQQEDEMVDAVEEMNKGNFADENMKVPAVEVLEPTTVVAEQSTSEKPTGQNEESFKKIAPIAITDIDNDEFVPSTPKKNSTENHDVDAINTTPSSESYNLFNNSERIDSALSNTATTQSGTASPVKRSMAQHLRPTVTRQSPSQPQVQGQSLSQVSSHYSEQSEEIPTNEISKDVSSNTNIVNQLEVPMREPEIQAIIDEKSRSNSLKSPHSDQFAGRNENQSKKGLQPTPSTSSLTKRKSVLKNSTSTQPLYVTKSNNASDAYRSLATAQNTLLNSKTAAPSTNARRQSVGTQDSNYVAYNRSRSGSAASSTVNPNGTDPKAPLAAAARAAQRHSVQNSTSSRHFDKQNRNSLAPRDSTYGGDELNFGAPKATNPKVEEAKKRILGNRAEKVRAKELYEKSKSRPQVKAEDLIALNNKTNSLQRKSSFEKVSNVVAPVFGTNPETNPKFGQPRDKPSMTSLTLRQEAELNYESYNINKHESRGFKSRFADDNSDTDIPISNTPVVPITNVESAPKVAASTPIASKQKSSSGFKLFKRKEKTEVSPKEHKESRFEKFFSEPHGPQSHRNFSGTSAITDTSMSTEGKKKKGFLKKMFNN
ncbi:hypothetical protein CANINC_002493 [Pichia inconspicua]|uniref:Eisosome protein SEG1 n=1 Tax=Pichia inconspicua TaxID=52247 RepID=A0A4T0X0X1_9ASCO|nr:hypothetical protein CANINC_002493 [[Candida] inconspicua]